MVSLFFIIDLIINIIFNCLLLNYIFIIIFMSCLFDCFAFYVVCYWMLQLFLCFLNGSTDIFISLNNLRQFLFYIDICWLFRLLFLFIYYIIQRNENCYIKIGQWEIFFVDFGWNSILKDENLFYVHILLVKSGRWRNYYRFPRSPKLIRHIFI